MNHKLRVLVRVDVDPGHMTLEVTGCLTQSNAPEECSPIPGEPDTINGLELSDYFEGTLDPEATVRALPDAALCQLADALYRQLDTSSPSFGAHTWYELATEELQNRHLTDANGPAADELAAGPALA